MNEFEKIKEWFNNNQDIYQDYLKDSSNYSGYNSPLGEILWWCKDNIYNPNSTERYYRVTQEHEDIIFGRKLLTLEEIKDRMLKPLLEVAHNYVSTKKSRDEDEDEDDYYDEEEEDGEGYYDSAGHCGNELFAEILDFWENFDTETDRDLDTVVSGAYCDDIDLDGGRDYLLSHSEFVSMAFNYYYHTLKYSLEKFGDDICNSTSINESIEDLWPPEIPSEEVVAKYRNRLSVIKFELNPGMHIKKILFHKKNTDIVPKLECTLSFEVNWNSTTTITYEVKGTHELWKDNYEFGMYEWDGKIYTKL